jgi:Tfp pilus assembly protein PilN
MISVNLSTLKKPLDLANVGGLDLSKINVKLVLASILFLYIPDFFLVSNFEEERTNAQNELDQLITEKTKLNRRVNSLKEFNKQIQDLVGKEKALSQKLEVVKNIITQKKNPWNVLVYVAKNIPPEIWLTEIEFKDDLVSFKGLSLDYANQGVFLDNLKKSVFFDKNITYTKSAAPGADSKALAPFEIKARIVRFE